MRREGKEGGFCGQFGQIMLTQHYVCKTYFSFLFVWRSQTIRPPSLPPRHGVQSLEGAGPYGRRGMPGGMPPGIPAGDDEFA